MSKGNLAGRVAVVTGASSGIGEAIALAVAGQGARVCAIGRRFSDGSEKRAWHRSSLAIDQFRVDLASEESIGRFLANFAEEIGRLDLLVHSAGVARQDLIEAAQIEDLDIQYAINVRAPYMLTQRLLPLLTRSHGQVVFVNSSVGVNAKRPEIGQYAATKHALKAIADSLREEVNPKGVRVLSVYLGRTATPMQQALCEREGSSYRPELLLQPEDVASVVLNALMLPSTAEVTDLSMRPMHKCY